MSGTEMGTVLGAAICISLVECAVLFFAILAYIDTWDSAKRKRESQIEDERFRERMAADRERWDRESRMRWAR